MKVEFAEGATGVRLRLSINAHCFYLVRDTNDAVSSLSPLAITSNDMPVSAAIAAHSDACPENVRSANAALMISEAKIFCRMMLNVRLE